MKKILCIVLSLLSLSGCTSSPQISTETTTAEVTSSVTSDEKESQYTRDDFVLFCNSEGSEENEAIIFRLNLKKL